MEINGNGYTINALNQSFPIFVTFLNDFTVSDCNFVGNISFSSVGMDHFNFINCSFTNSFGSIRSVETGTVHLIDCNFENSNPEDYGPNGAFEATQCGNVIIEYCNFTNLHNNYGAIYLENDNKNSISNCIFTNNTAAFGAAVNAGYLNELVIDNCSFFNNSVNNSGGAIFSTADNLIVNNSIFMYNSAIRQRQSDQMDQIFLAIQYF